MRPADAIMVGDTPADTLMGQKAKLGLTVGVLSGVGDKDDLADADVIVSDVTHCVDMILKPVDGRIHQGTNSKEERIGFTFDLVIKLTTMANFWLIAKFSCKSWINKQTEEGS